MKFLETIVFMMSFTFILQSMEAISIYKILKRVALQLAFISCSYAHFDFVHSTIHFLDIHAYHCCCDPSFKLMTKVKAWEGKQVRIVS